MSDKLITPSPRGPASRPAADQPAPAPSPPMPPAGAGQVSERNSSAITASRELSWKGVQLFYKHKHVAQLVRDARHPNMWRVQLPDRALSDMENFTRAKDAAVSLVLADLNRQEMPPGGPPVASNKDGSQ